jgi:hypothetical protein
MEPVGVPWTWVSTSQFTKRRRQGYKRSIMVPEMLVRNENMIFGARACCFIRETGGIASVLKKYSIMEYWQSSGGRMKIWITIAEYRGWSLGLL